MASMIDGAAQSSAGASVPVTFFTTTFHAHMPDQVLAIPVAVLPQGLNEVINQMLELSPPMPFDFLVGDEYITTSLDRFMRRRALSSEEALRIEYTPAMQAKEGNKLPHDDWVASVRAPVPGMSTVLITGAYDRCVRVWHGEECLAVAGGHTEAVKEVALHPHAPAQLADAKQPQRAGRKRQQGAEIGDVMFASGGKDGAIKAWAYDNEHARITCIGTVKQHTASVDTVDISPDGALLASGSWDKSVKVFSWASVLAEGDKKAPIAAFTDHARPVLSVRWSPSQRGVLYSTGLDGCVKVWDGERVQLMGTLKGEHAAQSLAVKPASTTADMLLVGCSDNRVRLFDSRQKSVAKTFAGHRQWVYGVAWMWRSDDNRAPAAGDCFASASEDATVRVWDLRCTSAALITQDQIHTDGVLDVTFCGGTEIASGGKDNKTKTFSVERNIV